jgi:2-succinyl-6-hydroxy-2,4-cyclohexadiene-1-carboxylate synthase
MSLHRRSAGAGPRVVLVHGFTQTAASLAPLAEHLSSAFEVVTVDLPGHGGSSAVRADLPGAARLLAGAGGSARYVGYSLGGRVCLRLAIDRPDLVEALVLIGASPGIADPAERAARRAADGALAAGLERDGVAAFLDRWLAQPLFATLPAGAAGLADRLANSADGLAAALRLLGTGAQEPLWDRLGELRMPVLLLSGDLDRKFGDIGRRMATLIGPNARQVGVADAGHAVHLEQPERTAALVAAFLSGGAGARPERPSLGNGRPGSGSPG